jgi:hypothetical protein
MAEVDEQLWLLTDVRWESGAEALRDQIAHIDDRRELERLLALAVEALMHAERRADTEIGRFQRRFANRKRSS